MNYIPSYSKSKLEEFRNYVKQYKAKVMAEFSDEDLEAAASAITEEYSTRFSKAPTNGDLRYTFFNNLLFNGELPRNVKIYFTNSTDNKIGSTGFKTSSKKELYRYFHNKELKDQRMLGCWYRDDNTIFILMDRIKAVVKRTDPDMSDDEFNYIIDRTLVHEMCHVWQDKVWLEMKIDQKRQYLLSQGIKPRRGAYKFEREDKEKGNGRPHSPGFQLIRNRIKRNYPRWTPNKAFDSSSDEINKYKNGEYGNPTLGMSKDEIVKTVNKEINKIENGLKLIDYDSKTFEKNGNEFKFKNGKFLNKDKEVLNFLVSYFNKNEKLLNVINKYLK